MLTLFLILPFINLDPTESLKFEVTPPILYRYLKNVTVYTNVFTVQYTVKPPRNTTETDSPIPELSNPNRSMLHTLNNEVIRDTDRNRIHRVQEFTKGFRHFQELSSPVVNESVFQELVVECLAQNLPLHLDSLIMNYFRNDLQYHQGYLSSLTPPMKIIAPALNPEWFLNKGFTQCRVNLRTGTLTWILRIPIQQDSLNFRVARLEPIRFRMNDVLCVWAEKTALVALAGSQLYEVITDDNKIDKSATRVTPFLETSDKTQCIVAIIRKDWVLSKLLCLLECSNAVDSEISRRNGRVLVTSIQTDIYMSCPVKEKLNIPKFGSLNLTLPCKCTLGTPEGNPIYPEDPCSTSQTESTVLLPTTWTKRTHFRNCKSLDSCLDINLTSGSSRVALPSIGNMLPSPRLRKTFYWGNDQTSHLIPRSSDGLVLLILQIVFLILTIPFSLVVICRYPLSRALYFACLFSMAYGLGDVNTQIGPTDLIPDQLIPKINWNSETARYTIAAVLSILALGVCFGMMCCCRKCGSRKCGLSI